MKGKKTGGRLPGSENKVTKEIKDRFKEFVDSNFHSVQGWLDSIAKKDPAEAMRLYLQFSERILGKVTTSSVDITSQGKELKAPVIHVVGDTPA